MELYILRHGPAAEKDVDLYPYDSERPLTQRGKTVTQDLAKKLKQLDLTFDVILTSPFLRALETAEIVAKTLCLKKKFKIIPTLAADKNPKSIVLEIQKNNSHHKKILLVGHEPYLTTLISILISGKAGSSIHLKKSGLCKLTLSHLHYRQCAILEWLIPPYYN